MGAGFKQGSEACLRGCLRKALQEAGGKLCSEFLIVNSNFQRKEANIKRPTYPDPMEAATMSYSWAVVDCPAAPCSQLLGGFIPHSHPPLHAVPALSILFLSGEV